MLDTIRNLPPWVWLIASAVVVALVFITKQTKNRWDDWLVRLGVQVVERFLASNGIRVDLDGDGKAGAFIITKAEGPEGASVQLDGPGIIAPKTASVVELRREAAARTPGETKET